MLFFFFFFKFMFMLLPRDKYAKTLSKLATILQETILFV